MQGYDLIAALINSNDYNLYYFLFGFITRRTAIRVSHYILSRIVNDISVIKIHLLRYSFNF